MLKNIASKRISSSTSRSASKECRVFVPISLTRKGAVGAVFRAIPYEIKTFDALGLPPVVSDMCKKPRGLVLVTGPTGSGKSTTLASMVDKINIDRHDHILTIEDPIEFLHNHKNCVVNQREVAADTHSFGAALRTALRQDPGRCARRRNA